MLIKTKTSLINFANVLNMCKYFDKQLDFYGGAGRIAAIEFSDNNKRNAAFCAIFEALQAEKKLIDISGLQNN